MTITPAQVCRIEDVPCLLRNLAEARVSLDQACDEVRHVPELHEHCGNLMSEVHQLLVSIKDVYEEME
jgi:hypothetical protein